MHRIRVLEPAANVLGFYDGRVEGYRFAAERNWVDAGALSLGVCSYALIDGSAALVYDTQVSVEHARFIRETLDRRGVDEVTVVLSHWHLDHVAGTEAFADCEVIANRRTAAHLAGGRSTIEAGTLEGPPAIDPLILPTRVFSERQQLTIGGLRVELIEAEIHSDDATVLWLPEQGLLFAGDTMEDTVTYVDEPRRLDIHLSELERISELGAARILPNHGDPELIAGGGYRADLIGSTQAYIRWLQRSVREPAQRDLSLRELLAGPLQAPALNYFAPYEEVHRENIGSVLAAAQG